MISVIMSVYNTPDEWLRQAIESVLCQDYRDYEFLIVDDCSSISNKQILDSYRKKDSRIHVLSNDQNLGLTQSLNRALAIAQGDFVARLDSDDMCLPNRFQKQLERFEKNERLVLCGTGSIRIIDGREESCRPLMGSSEFLKINLLFGNIFVHSSVMIRMSVLKENRLMYDENFRLAQDFELWSRLAIYGDIENLEDILCVHRVYNEQISFKQIELQNDYRDEIIQRNLKRIGLDVPKQEVERYLNLFHSKGKKEHICWIALYVIRVTTALIFHYGLKSCKMIKQVLWYSAWAVKKSVLR